MNSQILDFLDFLNGSPTSIQASHEIVKRLEESGFKALKKKNNGHFKLVVNIMFVVIPVL